MTFLSSFPTTTAVALWLFTIAKVLRDDELDELEVGRVADPDKDVRKVLCPASIVVTARCRAQEDELTKKIWRHV